MLTTTMASVPRPAKNFPLIQASRKIGWARTRLTVPS